MDDQAIRATVVHLQTLAFEQQKRIAEIERHARDIKWGVLYLIAGVLAIAYRVYFP